MNSCTELPIELDKLLFMDDNCRKYDFSCAMWVFAELSFSLRRGMYKNLQIIYRTLQKTK